MTDYFVRQDLQSEVSKPGLLPWAQEVAAAADKQDIYRSKEGRKTLRFERGGRSYFLKLHNGIGWGEIFKNLLQGRLPVLGALNEYRAVEALTRIGVDTMSIAAYTSRGRNPAATQSLIVTDDLIGTVSLEDYCANWANKPPKFATRLKLLLKLADSARLMHSAGINHRDFYICHFHLDESSLFLGPVRCHLIDLHRAQIRRATPRRWRVKDLGGLYFSAMDCGLRQRDLLRFMHHYCDGGLREALKGDEALWQDVTRVATRLYIKEHGCSPPGMKAEGAHV
jgi:heptose I phosphotransferase